jgi:predicted nucleic acid-binding protein
VSQYVVDASVAVKWFIPEVYSDEAIRLRTQGHTLHVPAFFALEFSNALCKKVRRRELTKAQATYALQELQNLPLFRHADEALLPSAFDLATDTQAPLYDCLYLSLAFVVDARFVTADRKCAQILSRSRYGSCLLWIEGLP